MILPSSFVAGIVLLILSFACLGSWANTFKLARKWRYELYCYDLAFGFVIAAAIAAFTFGLWNSQELTFQDNLLITGYRQMLWAIVAGAVFNLGNVLLLVGVSVAGLAVAFPIAFGIALIIDVGWNFALDPHGNIILMLGGVVLTLAALTIVGFAYTSRMDSIAEAAKKAALQPDPRAKQSKKNPKAPQAGKGLILSVISGIILSFFTPILGNARIGENGVAPYGLALLFAAGLFGSTLFYTPFLLNFPVAGAPIQLRDYFKGSMRQHLLGVAGGAILAIGILGTFVMSGSPASAQVGSGWNFGLPRAGAVLALLWGMLVWREFKGPSERPQTLLWGTLVLYAAGLAMVSIAPLYGSR